MQTATTGREFHQDRRVPVAMGALTDLTVLADTSRMKLVFLDAGAGVIANEHAQQLVVSPAVILLDHTGNYRLSIGGTQAHGTVVLFHPQYVNDALSFATIDDQSGLSKTDRQDIYLLRHFLPHVSLGERALTLEPHISRHFSELLASLGNELQNQPDGYWPCRSRSFFLQILIMLDHLAAKKPALATNDRTTVQALSWTPLSNTHSCAQEVVDYLVSNYDDELSVPALAKTFATNRTTLQRKFKSATGVSLAQYIIRMRVHIAALLLRDTSLNVSEIMGRTGFKDQTHFSRMFKKHAGRSPSDFRALFHVPRYIVGP